MEKSFDERVAEAKAEVPEVSPQQASQQKHEHPETLFIDPRDVEDIHSTTGMIPCALNLSLDSLSDHDNDLPQGLSYNHHSLSGWPMGALAAHALKRRGYQNVYFIDGGTQG